MGKIHSIHSYKDRGGHLEGRQAGIGHFHIQTSTEEYIKENVEDGNEDQESGNGLPFHEACQIGNICKRRAKGVDGKCHEITANAQRLLPIILGKDGKMAD